MDDPELSAGSFSPPRSGPLSATRRLHEQVEAIYRAESRRVLATLIRLLGDFDLAEEALHDAFRAALEQWPRDGVPANPARLAGLGRPLQGHRRHPPARALRRIARGRSPTALDAATE